MTYFLKERFGEITDGTAQPSSINVQPVEYKDRDFEERVKLVTEQIMNGLKKDRLRGFE